MSKVSGVLSHASPCLWSHVSSQIIIRGFDEKTLLATFGHRVDEHVVCLKALDI